MGTKAPPDGLLRSPETAPRAASERRLIGHVAGIVLTVGALGALATTRLLSPRPVPASFDLVVVATVCSGVACILIPWGRLPAGWLHAIPICATVQTAIGIRVGHLDPGLASNYYLLVGAFAAFAFLSRWQVAAQVLLAAMASALPLLYDNRPGSETSARTLIGILILFVIAGIITVLREGLQNRQRELEQLTLRDPLTGVGNYRLLSDRLDYEIARHHRLGGSLTVLLLDLDGFKQINDTFGHLVGDRVLTEVARALESALRGQDTLARQGGDEFSILAPETAGIQAPGLAGRVQEAVDSSMQEAVTASVGWATFPEDGTEATTLLAVADADLRRAKQALGIGTRGSEGGRPNLVRLVEATSG